MNQHVSFRTFEFFRHQPARGKRRPGHNPTDNPTMGEIIAARFSRRGFLQGLARRVGDRRDGQPDGAAHRRRGRAPPAQSAFTFNEVEAGVDENHHVADGYDADVLLRWGDPLFADAPDSTRRSRRADAQARQFGYNNDYVGFIPLDGSAEHGLLVVNHEYTNPHLMFPGIVTIAESGKIEQVAARRQEQVDVEMAAHGGTIVEIRKDGGKWQVGDGRQATTAASPRRPRWSSPARPPATTG